MIALKGDSKSNWTLMKVYSSMWLTPVFSHRQTKKSKKRRKKVHPLQVFNFEESQTPRSTAAEMDTLLKRSIEVAAANRARQGKSPGFQNRRESNTDILYYRLSRCQDQERERSRAGQTRWDLHLFEVDDNRTLNPEFFRHHNCKCKGGN